MNYPKIKFRAMSLSENIEIIEWAFFEEINEFDIRQYCIECFPELSTIDDTYTKKEIKEKIKKVVTNDYLKYEKIINEEVLRYNGIWENLNDKYFQTLSNYLNIQWPDKVKFIDASVGLIPTFPRCLDTFSFSISTGLSLERLITVSAHETCHFLWYEKFKKLFPEISRKEFDSPYIPWLYSEMVVDPIINSREINEVLHINEQAYDYFYELIYNGENVMDTLKQIFSSDECIEERIKKGYFYIIKALQTSKKI